MISIWNVAFQIARPVGKILPREFDGTAMESARGLSAPRMQLARHLL